MRFEGTEIEHLTGLLAANVRFKLDYRMYTSNKRKLLIVEGATDYEFIKHIQNDCVDCIVAAKVFNSNNQFRTWPGESINCKNAIVKIITGISHYPSPFIKYADDVDKWDLYGMVDSDCEEIGSSRPTPRLFVTDTHDLETLLLSTDEDIFLRLEECEIQHEDITNAFFIAYQLATIRCELKQYSKDIDLQTISCGSRDVDFSSFIEDYKICVPELIKYMSDNSRERISNSKIKTIVKSICACKSLKKKIDAEGIWKQSVQEFSASMPSDFWMTVNGHDILQLLLLFSEDAAQAYGNNNGYSLNRSFEMSLIAAYDYSNFRKTMLSKEMSDQGLIKN